MFSSLLFIWLFLDRAYLEKIIGISSLNTLDDLIKQDELLNSLINSDECSSCVGQMMKGILNVHIHVDSNVAKYIKTEIRNNLIGYDVDLEGFNDPAAKEFLKYISKVFMELNESFMMKFGLELVPILDPATIYNVGVEEINSELMSCEKPTSIQERNNIIFNTYRNTMKDSIGIQLNILGCLYNNPEQIVMDSITSGTCGGVMSVEWLGIEHTKEMVQSIMIQFLTKIKNPLLVSSRKDFSDKDVKDLRLAICNYVENCIGGTPNNIGQLVPIEDDDTPATEEEANTI